MANEVELSFTRGLFAGEVHDELIFPYPKKLDETNPDEAKTVRRLLHAIDTKLDGVVDSEKFDEEETIGDEVIQALARYGFLGMTIPKEYGGLGLSSTGYARVFESLAALDPSLGVFIGVHCGLGSKSIVLYGNEEQKAKWLPKLAKGEVLGAYALTEPEVGSDAQHIKAQATLSPDGKHWILTGTKIWIGNGHRAGVIATFAQTEVERKGKKVLRPTAFLIEPTMPGFRVAGTFRKLGIRGSTQAQLEFENLMVPAENVLGEVGKGFTVAVNVLNAGRLTLLAGCTGGAKALLKEFATYAEQRIQFGSPLSAFEITQRKVSTLASEIYAADAMLGVLTKLATEDEVDWSLEAAIGKVFASDLVWKAADELVQLAGGRGFVKTHPYERYLRDSRINRIFEGANEILRLFIALNGIQSPAEHLKEVGAALREPMKNLGLLSEYAASRVRAAFRASATLDVELHPSLKTHKEYFERHVGDLKVATERAILKYKNDIINRQMVIERLANMAIDLFATACVISRTQALIEENSAEACQQEMALCTLFCVDAGRRLRSARESLNGREEEIDAIRRQVAEYMREQQDYFVEDTILMGM
jgi:alkylation response protein AidB-like acyl-CoA dehydrogenase